MDLLSPATSNANNPPYASSKSGSAPPSAGPGRRQRAGARGPAHLTASRPPIERSMRLGAASRNSPPQADLELIHTRGRNRHTLVAIVAFHQVLQIPHHNPLAVVVPDGATVLRRPRRRAGRAGSGRGAPSHRAFDVTRATTGARMAKPSSPIVASRAARVGGCGRRPHRRSG